MEKPILVQLHNNATVTVLATGLQAYMYSVITISYKT